MNIDNLSDRELATCVDEFVKRAINHARNTGITTMLSLSISATQFGKDSDYEIKHRASVGDYNKANVSETNNLVRATDNACSQWLADQNDAPTTVRPMITHQPEPEQEPEAEAPIIPEDAEFTEVNPALILPDEDDEVPF